MHAYSMIKTITLRFDEKNFKELEKKKKYMQKKNELVNSWEDAVYVAMMTSA